MRIQGFRRSDLVLNCQLTCLSIGRLFQGESLFNVYPGLKRPDFAKPTSRLAFWRHLTQHEGHHSVATAAWANLFSRSAATRPSTSGLKLVSAAKMSKLQGDVRATPLQVPGRYLKNYFVHNCPTETILISSSIPEGRSALSGTGQVLQNSKQGQK